MFEDILFPVMIVGIIGLLAGVGLAVAAIVMAVPCLLYTSRCV